MADNFVASLLSDIGNALPGTPFVAVTFINDGGIISGITLTSPRNTDKLEKLTQAEFKASDALLKEVATSSIKGVQQIEADIPELAQIAKDFDCQRYATIPVRHDEKLFGFVWLGEIEPKSLKKSALTPFTGIVSLAIRALSKTDDATESQNQIEHLKKLIVIHEAISNSTNLYAISAATHELVQRFIGNFSFILALYDEKTQSIRIPYIYDEEKIESIDTFPLGEGITSILIRTQQPLLITKDTEKRMAEMGAKIVGSPASSWMGVPVIENNKAVGAIIVQDLHQEEAFDHNDLNTLILIAEKTTSAIQNARSHEDLKGRFSQIQTAAEIARDISSALNLDELLRKAVLLIRDEFNYYYAAIFMIDSLGQYATIREATGDAGTQMKRQGHKLAVGSKSIVGYVAGKGEALIVDDTTKDATHLPNPLLPNTRSEASLPLKIGDRILGVLDVQSAIPFAFGPDNISILQMLADQLAIAVNNSELFAETQEHLSQHRLLHHITTSAASGTTLDEALSSAVKGLQVTLGGDRVLIMLSDRERKNLVVKAWVGYSDEVADNMTAFGAGITGWVAAHKKPLRIDDVTQDTRYMKVSPNTRSELAVPLIFRNDVLGVLNVESEQVGAYNESDEEMLGTLAGSLAAIIANARLMEQIRKQVERERVLYEVSSKIRRSTDIQTILTTTAREISRITGAKRAQIEVGIEPSDKGNQ